MGSFLAKLASSFGRIKDAKILMVGLDAAGKTTTLYKLKLGENVTTIPTIGFNVEGIQSPSQNLNLTVWDIGGQDKIRPLWRHYFMGSGAVIFVVDSNDRLRILEARDELLKVLESDEIMLSTGGGKKTGGKPSVLILANKQDLPNSMSPSEICEKMDLKSTVGDTLGYQWFLQPCVATSGDGLYEGIHWLEGQLA